MCVAPSNSVHLEEEEEIKGGVLPAQQGRELLVVAGIHICVHYPSIISGY